MKRLITAFAVIVLLMGSISAHATQKYLVQVSIDGSIVTFSDGTKYRVERYDFENTAKWRDRDLCDIGDLYLSEWVRVPILNLADGSKAYALRIQ